jgi:hypothetical protein
MVCLLQLKRQRREFVLEVYAKEIEAMYSKKARFLKLLSSLNNAPKSGLFFVGSELN